jgi:predicted MFS family arabinose efflux permease
MQKPAALAKFGLIRSSAPLIVLCLGGGCIYILPYLSVYLYIPMKDALRLDNLQLGLMQSAMGFTSMIFYWPGGYMADRFSPRKLIAASMLANALLGFWLATLPSFRVLMIIQLSMGVFLTLTFWSSMIKMVRQLARADQQGRYFGILEGGRNVTTVLLVAGGLYLFAWMGSNGNGLRWTIISLSVMLLVISVLSWLYLPESKTTDTAAACEIEELSLAVAIRRVVRIPTVWLAMFIILCAYMTSAGQAYFTPFATDVYRQSVVFGGVLATIIASTGIFAAPAAGLVADRWITSRTVLWLFTTLASCLLLFAIVPGGSHLLPLLVINSIVIGCLFFALRGIYFALLEEGAVPLALTGTATGLISLVAFTPDVFVPALAGHLLDRYPAEGLGYRIFFLILSVFCLAGAGLTLLFRRHVSARLAK